MKEKLLGLGVFVDNKYLDLYCSLIDSNLQTKKETAKTQSHHIIPKCYFKSVGRPCDNTKTNLVNLLYVDHARAHFYLSLCLSDKLLAGQNALVLKYILNQVQQKKYTSIEELLATDELQRYYEIRKSYLNSDEYRQKKRAQAKNQFKDGYIWITDGQVNHTVSSKLDWQKHFPDFWQGRTMTEESRKLRSASGKEAYEKYTQEQKDKLSARFRQSSLGNSNHAHAVYCVSLDKTFNSIKEASDAVCCATNSIISCCVGAQLKAGNHFWAYAEDTERIQFIKDNYLTANNVYSNYTFNPKSVRCVETGIIYSDITTAAKALGMYCPSHISTACKTGKKSGGYHWEYVT